MTALFIAYFLGYGNHIKKALRGYVTIALCLVVFSYVSGLNLAYAQSTGHEAAQSSISDSDLPGYVAPETSSGDTVSGATTSTTSTSTLHNDAEGTAVDALNDLLDLQSVYKSLDVFKGNNTEFYQLLRDRLIKYDTATQARKFISIVDKLTALNPNVYQHYGLNKAGLMDVLPEMADKQRLLLESGLEEGSTQPKSVAAKRESYNTDNLTLTYELFYGVTKATVGLPLVFHMGNTGPSNIKRATRRFDTGKIHTCSWKQCERVGVSYEEAGSHEIILIFEYANGEFGRHIFSVDVVAGTTTKTHNSASERVIIDVMDTTKSGSSSKSTAIQENTTTSGSSSEKTSSSTDTELDQAFEKLLLSIFGE